MRNGPGRIEIICVHGCDARIEVPMPSPDVGDHFTDVHYLTIGRAVASALVLHAISRCAKFPTTTADDASTEPDITCGRCGNPASAHGDKPDDSPPGCGWTKAMVRDHYENWWGPL